MKENSPKHTEVGQVTAKDLDLFPYNRISFYLNGSHARALFTIDPDTGIIYTLQPLDRELQSVYVFVVGIQTALLRSSVTAEVKVAVDDVNDCAPTWVFPNSSDTVHVTFEFGFDEVALATLVAIDADVDDNAKLRSVLLISLIFIVRVNLSVIV